MNYRDHIILLKLIVCFKTCITSYSVGCLCFKKWYL